MDERRNGAALRAESSTPRAFAVFPSNWKSNLRGDLTGGLVAAVVTIPMSIGFGLLALHAPRPVLVRFGVLLVLVCAQGLVGTVQFFTGVPAALVAVHVLGAAACTAATAALWASMRERSKPEPVKG